MMAEMKEIRMIPIRDYDYFHDIETAVLYTLMLNLGFGDEYFLHPLWDRLHYQGHYLRYDDDGYICEYDKEGDQYGEKISPGMELVETKGFP